MRFYTSDECEAWLKGRNRVKPDEVEGTLFQRISYPPKSHRIYYITHWIANEMMCSQPALLWMTEWGIWGSSENWHLYYRLRESYGDHRLLHEAPGHFFLDYEAEDLRSFLHLSMLSGWGGYLITAAGNMNLFFSHDEFIDFYSDSQGLLDETKDALNDKPANVS